MTAQVPRNNHATIDPVALLTCSPTRFTTTTTTTTTPAFHSWDHHHLPPITAASESTSQSHNATPNQRSTNSTSTSTSSSLSSSSPTADTATATVSPQRSIPPSSRQKRLAVKVDLAASPPSSTISKNSQDHSSKRRYRRHPKPDQHAPKRPLTAYASFANHLREEKSISSMSFVDIAKEVGRQWQEMPPADKRRWEDRASAVLHEYNVRMERYKKTNESRGYQAYLGNFKRVQSRTRCKVKESCTTSTSSSPDDEVSPLTVGAATTTSCEYLDRSPEQDSFPHSDFDWSLRPRLYQESSDLIDSTFNVGAFPIQSLHDHTLRPRHPHTILPLDFCDNSPLSLCLTDFRNRSRSLMQQGYPFAALAGCPDGIDVVSFFFDVQTSTVDAWAGRMYRAHEDLDVFVRLACVYYQTQLMKWMIEPSLQNYANIPDMAKPTQLQLLVPHPASIGTIPVPALRDALINAPSDWLEVCKRLSCSWTLGLNHCITQDPYTTQIRLTDQFMQHVCNPANWTLGYQLQPCGH